MIPLLCMAPIARLMSPHLFSFVFICIIEEENAVCVEKRFYLITTSEFNEMVHQTIISRYVHVM